MVPSVISALDHRVLELLGRSENYKAVLHLFSFSILLPSIFFFATHIYLHLYLLYLASEMKSFFAISTVVVCSQIVAAVNWNATGIIVPLYSYPEDGAWTPLTDA